MDLIKQYLIQCIVMAANSLRLSSEKIEVVAMLKDSIARTADIYELIRNMKKITELSKFAIRLGEVNNYISNPKIDFLKISDDFKEHSHSLVRELSNLLDILTPQNYRLLNAKLEKINVDVVLGEGLSKSDNIDRMLDGMKSKSDDDGSETAESYDDESGIVSAEGEEDEDFFYDDFEKRIVTPIKDIEPLLKQIVSNDFDRFDLEKFIDAFEDNLALSEKKGFEIITKMHQIFLNALYLIAKEKIVPGKDFVEKMRSCLIVIVAVVRGKDVDISTYLKKAENFSFELIKYSMED